jgi:hypothetical protein
MYKTKEDIIDDYLMHFGEDTWNILNSDKFETFILALDALRISLKMPMSSSTIAITFNIGMQRLESQGFLVCKLNLKIDKQVNVTIH